MRKIIFCLQTMVNGGVEKELCTILKLFDQNEYDISILILYDSDNEILNKIPKGIKIINIGFYGDLLKDGVKNRVVQLKNEKRFFNAMILIVIKIIGILLQRANLLIYILPYIYEHYDIAICYHLHSSIMLEYVANKIKANIKMAWIHNDFQTTKYQINKYKKYLDNYDKFIAVSYDVCNEFLLLCPQYKERTVVFHNIVDTKEIQEKARQINMNDQFFTDRNIKLLTVGRFTEQKGFDIAVKLCKKIKEKRTGFRWYFIGWGPKEETLKDMVYKHELSDTIIFLGKKENPYPYMANCDIYIQPSRHEAYCMTILEAKSVFAPIVCTNFAGAKEEIIDGETGYIVEMGNYNLLEQQIIKLIDMPVERERISNNIRNMKENSDMSQLFDLFFI